MHRKPSTKWLPKEIKAFQLLLPIDETDLASMERYYRMNWPPRHDKNILRTDLLTLLNRWTGELDRANIWNESHPEKPKPRKIIPLPLTGGAPEPLTPEDEERREKFLEEMRRRNPGSKAFKPRSAYQEVKEIMGK